MSRSRPTTPVRRVSRGSISSHLRASASGGLAGSGSVTRPSHGASGSAGDGLHGPVPTPLAFLTQAMGDLAYETATLQSNLEAIDEIQSALHTFDESFSMFLYGLRMNAFCVEWPEAPGEENFERAEMRKAQTALAGTSRNAPRASFAPSIHADITSETAYDATVTGPADQTYMTQDDEDAALMQRKPNVRSASNSMAPRPATSAKPALKSALKKPSITPSVASSTRKQPQHQAAFATKAAVQPVRITAAEKKRREAAAEQVIDCLPLEYRGSDPSAKQLAMRVLLALIAAGPKGVRINEIVRSPDLPQAKVNKCLIALVAAKQVLKRSENGAVYQLDPEKNAIVAS